MYGGVRNTRDSVKKFIEVPEFCEDNQNVTSDTLLTPLDPYPHNDDEEDI